MIKTNTLGYPLIYQSDNSYAWPTYTGAVQWNGSTKKFQVSSGSSWYDIDNTVTYSVDKALIEVMHWAKKKMDEEKHLAEKAKSNPALLDLLNQRTDIDLKIKIIETLTS